MSDSSSDRLLAAGDFRPHLDSDFTVRVGAESLVVRLAEVTASGQLAGGQREPFELIFHGPVKPWFPQGTYELTHAVMPPQSIFLVPLGPQGGAMRYQAVFN